MFKLSPENKMVAKVIAVRIAVPVVIATATYIIVRKLEEK